MKICLGAALDVFTNEPINLDNPLLKNSKVLLSPHSATFTDECTSEWARKRLKILLIFLKIKLITL